MNTKVVCITTALTLSLIVFLCVIPDPVSSLPKTGEYDDHFSVDSPFKSLFGDTVDGVGQLLTGQGDYLLSRTLQKRSPQRRQFVTQPPRQSACSRCNYCRSGRCKNDGNCC